MPTTSTYIPKIIDCSISKLNKELVAMKDKAEEIRMELMPLMSENTDDVSQKIKLFSMITKMQQHDKRNQAYLKAIFTNCNWPKELSKEAHTSIYLILQHSDDALMREYYPKVEEMVALGYLDPDDAATMFDRLQMNANLPQRYGTQTFENTNNQNVVWPIQDAEQLDTLRNSVGLSSMQEYIKYTREHIDIAIVWDKTLTIERANRFKK